MINNLLSSINKNCEDLKDITIISRTHGQPASPTKLGKEFRVFWIRITNQLSTLKIYQILQNLLVQMKLQPHKVAYPNIEEIWQEFYRK